jgi:polyribonucleotide 5'-hydroxyl-kinase
MVSYVNTHFALQKLRSEASASGRDGPRVLVVGPNNAGKTSLVKLLASYAVRQGGNPMVVNTDNREGLLSLPSTLTATVMATVLDVEEGWGSSPTSGPSPVPVKLPLVYHYGLSSPEDAPKLYKPIITRLALATTSRLADDPAVRAAGILVDTSGVLSQGKSGYDLISHIVSEFSINAIFTLGSERLHSDMIKRFSPQSITVLKLAKSGGCVDRDEGFLAQVRQGQIREYFFGTLKRTLSPHTQSMDFSALSIFKIREPGEALMSFMPGQDEDEAKDELPGAIYEKVVPEAGGMMGLTHCVLAVMYAGIHDSHETIRDACVMGFVYVAEVDEKKRKLKVLAPLSGGFSDRPLVWGKWPEAGANLIG